METKDIYELFLRCGCRFSTDSRRGEGLFFALRGERHDAHDFAASALASGADYAVVERLVEGVSAEKLILVDSVEGALQALARHHRRQFGIPVIGVTGTNGKTTTKELLAAALGGVGGKSHNVLYTQGNLNNHLGVPMTLLRLSAIDDLAVIEMGANHEGEIKLLCGIAEPTHGLITNIGNAHLEGFGSPEGVVRAKSELFQYLAATGGTAFFNDSDPILKRVVENIPHLKAISYAPPKTSTNGDGRLVFDYFEQNHQTFLTGSYNAANIGAALAIAGAMGISPVDAARAVSAYRPSNNRSQIIATPRNTLIMDAYNANPTSMIAALENLVATPGDAKIAILGQMNELGVYSADAHAQVVTYANNHGVSLLLVGPNFAPFSATHPHFADTDQLVSHLNATPPQGATILIKGSNSMRLFTLPERCPNL